MTELHEAYNEKKKDTFFDVCLFMSTSKLSETNNHCMHALSKDLRNTHRVKQK